MFLAKVVEKIKRHILCLVAFFLIENHAIYEKMWSGAGHIWQYGACALHAGYLRLQMHTPRLCNTHCFSTATMLC